MYTRKSSSRTLRLTLWVASLAFILSLAGCGGGGTGGGSTAGGTTSPPVADVPHEFLIGASAGANAGLTSASITDFASGPLGTAQTQPLSNAEAVIAHPNNQFVYAANGGQTLSSFAVDPSTGALSLSAANIGESVNGGGASFQLKSLAIDPAGQFVVAISAGAQVQDVQFFVTGADGSLNSTGTEFITAAQLNGVPTGVALTTIGGQLVLLVTLDQAANNVLATTVTFDGTNLTAGTLQTATAGGAGVVSVSALSLGRSGTTPVAYVTTREGNTGGLTAIPLAVSGNDVTPLNTEVVQSIQRPAISVTSDSAGHVYVGLLDTLTNVQGFTFDATGQTFATNGVLGSTVGQANVSDVLLDPSGQGRFLYASNDSGSVSNISVFPLGVGGALPATATGFSVGDTVQQLTAVKTLGTQ